MEKYMCFDTDNQFDNAVFSFFRRSADGMTYVDNVINITQEQLVALRKAIKSGRGNGIIFMSPQTNSAQHDVTRNAKQQRSALR